MPHEPKYPTGQQCVEALRIMAAYAALDVIRPLMLKGRSWKAKTPTNQRRLIARLDTICSCIEMLTIYGSYVIERDEALERAKGLQ